jgi:AcrR family transcriptional regulator
MLTTRPRLAQRLQGGGGDPPGAEQVDLEHPGGILARSLAGALRVADPGAVDEDVDPAQPPDRLVDRAIHRSLIRDVAGEHVIVVGYQVEPEDSRPAGAQPGGRRPGLRRRPRGGPRQARRAAPPGLRRGRRPALPELPEAGRAALHVLIAPAPVRPYFPAKLRQCNFHYRNITPSMASETPARPRMSAAARREQLLDVTKEIVGEQGFHALSVEGVARRAEITRPVVYGHFGDLAALLEAMVEREGARALAQLAEILPTELAEDGSPRGDLRAALGGYLAAVAADPITWRLVLIPPEGAPTVLREQISRGRDAVVAALAAVVRPGLGPGSELPDPELTARMLSAVADETARLMLTHPRRYPRDRLLAHADWLLSQLEP